MDIPNILIADDEVEMRKNIIEYCNRSIYCNFDEAEDGEKTIEAVNNNPYDIILLDIRMPKKNGISVMDEIRSNTENMVILVITAWDSDLLAKECEKRQVECIPKPFSMKFLLERISQILKDRNKYIPKTQPVQ